MIQRAGAKVILVSGVKAAYHMVREKWKDHVSRKYKHRNVRIITDPHLQSRAPESFSRQSGKMFKDRQISEETAANQIPRSDSLDSEALDAETLDAEDQDSVVDPSETETSLSEPEVSQTDQLNLPVPQIIRQIRTVLSDLKRDAVRLDRVDLKETINAVEQAIATNNIEVIADTLRQSRMSGLSHFIPVLSTRIQETTPRPPEPESGTHNKPDTQHTTTTSSINQLLRDTVKAYHCGRVNILVGDITELKSVHGLPVDAIVCPAGGPLSDKTPAKAAIIAAEPYLQEPELQQKLRQMEGGKSAVMPADQLRSEGVQHIIHPATPHPEESDQSKRLFLSYVSAINQAREKGVRAIAIPVMGEALSPELACKFAAEAAHYCQNTLIPGPPMPNIYFVFPRTKAHLSLYKTMDVTLSLQTSSTPEEHDSLDESSDGYPKLGMPKKQVNKLLGKILPARHGFNPMQPTPKKIQWMNREIQTVCKLMSQGDCPLSRYERIQDYLGKAYSRMQDMTQAGKIAYPSQFEVLEEYLEKKIQILEIFERKQSKIRLRRHAGNNTSEQAGSSYFSTSSIPHVFERFCEPALKKYYLRPMSGAGQPLIEAPDGKIMRPVNGVMNACRTALWVKALVHLYQKHGDPDAIRIREEEIPLLQMAAIYDSSARKDGGPNLWAEQSAAHCQETLTKEGIDESTAQTVAACITDKHLPFAEKSILGKILHDAVAMDTMRLRQNFTLESLDFTRQFGDQVLAVKEVGQMCSEVRATLQRQNDLAMNTGIWHDKLRLYNQDVHASYNSAGKEVWEHSNHPYNDMEDDIDLHSPILANLLEDE